jgi:hypothetical protein
MADATVSWSTSEFQWAFLQALESHGKPLIEELYQICLSEIGGQSIIGAVLEATVRNWAKAWKIEADWMVRAGVETVERWRRQPSTAMRRSLKRPSPLTTSKPTPEPFCFQCGGIEWFEPTAQAEARIRSAFERALNEYLTPCHWDPPRGRQRDGRPADVRFEWLAKSLDPSITITQLAKDVGVERPNVSTQIGRARSELGFPRALP